MQSDDEWDASSTASSSDDEDEKDRRLRRQLMIGSAKIGVVVASTAVAKRLMSNGPVDEDDVAVAAVAFTEPSQSTAAPGGQYGSGGTSAAAQ